MSEMKMGECKMEGAYEIAEILIKGGRLEQMMEEGERFPHTLDHTLAGWYLYHPQPSAEDIVGVVGLEKKGGWYSLTFKIRRGKEMLAAFFNQHHVPQVSLSFKKVGGLDLYCGGCEQSVFLPWDSFGHLGGMLVREAVAPASDAPENKCTRAVRRPGDSSDSGSKAQRGAGLTSADGV